MSDEKDQVAEDSTESIMLKAALWVIVICIALALLSFGLFDKWETRGQFGDMFGAVNALFSGLAFAGVLIAIMLQRQELKLQREELRMTREELKRSAEAQEKSEEALRRQAASLKATARLNAITILLKNAEAEIDTIRRGGAYTGGSQKEAKYNSAIAERKRLLADLREIYESKDHLAPL